MLEFSLRISLISLFMDGGGEASTNASSGFLIAVMTAAYISLDFELLCREARGSDPVITAKKSECIMMIICAHVSKTV